jgi:uncharacterized Zn-finger protein
MSEPKAPVELAAKDLQGPGVTFCPNAKMALWSNHPKVFIDVASRRGRRTAPHDAALRSTAHDAL